MDLKSIMLSEISQRKKDKYCSLSLILGFPGGSDSKESACNAGDAGSIPGSGRSPEEGNGNPFQYSCLENPMDRGTLWAIVPGVAKSWTRLSDLTLSFHHLYMECKK